jgi:hypothetical protein
MPDAESPWHQLMYGLYYPGVLGTGVVLTALRASPQASFHDVLWDPSIELATVAGLFYSASFVSGFHWPAGVKARYSILAFFLDCVEVVLMFLCFYYLRLFDPPTLPLPEPRLRAAYIVLALDVLLQFAWRCAAGLEPWVKWWLRLIVAAILVVGAFVWKYSPWVSMSIAVIVAIFVIVYVVSDTRYKESLGTGN